MILPDQMFNSPPLNHMHIQKALDVFLWNFVNKFITSMNP